MDANRSIDDPLIAALSDLAAGYAAAEAGRRRVAEAKFAIAASELARAPGASLDLRAHVEDTLAALRLGLPLPGFPTKLAARERD